MKVDFLKVENILSDTLRKIFIDRLAELAAIANLIQDPKASLTVKMIEEIVLRFQGELKQIKEKDPKLYQRLELSSEDEMRFSSSPGDYTQKEWLRLRVLKEKIDDLKRELQGEHTSSEHNEKQVEKERRRHVNKRFNIRENWLPLH